jgi:septal ring factor EnvC (AmiA/AmiB activator)
VLVAAFGILSSGLLPAAAQTAPRPPGEIPYLNFPGAVPAIPPGNVPTAGNAPISLNPPGNNPSAAASPATALDALKQRDQELAAIRGDQRKAIENEIKLKREIEAIGGDRRKLSAQLIETAARVRSVEDEIAKTEERLKPLDEKEQLLRKSLEGRRTVIAEVLAALQRIGRNPPPAIMVKPEDALQSVRSAMLLGALLPEMRQETEALLADLAALVGVRKDIADARDRLDRDLKALADGNQRLTLLLEQRQKQLADAEHGLTGERQRASQLARQAEDLRVLILRIEQGIDPSTRAARVAARAGDGTSVTDGRPDLAALKDPGRLAPAVAFASARKMLPLPVNGARIREFGAPDGAGGTEKGLSLATRPGGQITAPCDGWVVYAGPFRNYGQLLILNAGGGYHVLLAGMERISVDLGQFVVTGEPVAVMGGQVQTAAPLAVGSNRPVLYVEFRKDGVPVDPGPWWAASDNEKVRG